ncbi:sensor histidine kinase [Amycolatopsis sp. H20-H5]|uniref:sensor histidine kinase n=1 Tax=Amycolatopsis sp. H20-H5 TaxID=3046309 RepID=UPI002DB6C8EF|nr:histidine kinase [Amycolatopsis sp. H20-H5]MEC3976948.1 histidine kinase [Amycolatopsis sp. H20-H5]
MTAEPRGVAGVDQRPRRARYLARAIVTLVFCSFCVIGVLHVAAAGSSFWGVIVGLLAAGALLGIQLLYFTRPTVELRSPRGYALLAIQACLVYLPLLPFGQAWIPLAGFLAGSMLLVLPSPLSWTGYGLVVVSMGAVQMAVTASALDSWYTVVAAALSGLSVFLLTRLARLVTELYSARTELARGAVAEERLRFARDLHDLLGQSLSSITFKGEVIHRLVRKDPDRARSELVEITEIARRALANARSVAHGYRKRSLEQESRAARSVLAASDVEARFDLDQTDLPVQIRAVLATALHEGVSNMLRHSTVEHCEVSLHRSGNTVTLEMVNDGAGPGDAVPEPGSAGGLRGLTTKVAALGGTVTAGPAPGGRFRLDLVLPVPEDTHTEDAPKAENPPVDLSGRMAKTLLNLVLCGFALAAVLHLLYFTETPSHLMLSVGSLTATLVLQLCYFSRPTARLNSPLSYGLLVVQGCLIYLPLFEVGAQWVSLPGLLAGSALLVLRPSLGWTVVVATIVSNVWIRGGFTAAPGDIPFNVLATMNTTLLVFGLSWLTRLTTELDATRLRLAEVAVAEERLRFARDLHDLLGLSLSAIVLKTELADRILLADPVRATTELEEILVLSRHALADVRSVATGYRELSLDKESESAEAALIAADVQVQMELRYGELPTQVRTVLAVVLREGVTNVLRHSKVELCEIAVHQTADWVSLEIVNDGVGDDHIERRPRSAEGGNGIRNLSDRVATLGGELTAEREADGRFRLRAVVPA